MMKTMKVMLLVLIAQMIMSQDIKMSVTNNAMANVSRSLNSEQMMKNVSTVINTFYSSNYYTGFDSKNLSIHTSKSVTCKDNSQGCYSAISRVRYQDLVDQKSLTVSVIDENLVIFNISGITYQGQMCVHYLGKSNTSEGVFESCRIDYRSKFNLIVEGTFNLNLTNDKESNFTTRSYISDFTSSVCQSSYCQQMSSSLLNKTQQLANSQDILIKFFANHVNELQKNIHTDSTFGQLSKLFKGLGNTYQDIAYVSPSKLIQRTAGGNVDVHFITRLLKLCDVCADSRINVGDVDQNVVNKTQTLKDNQIGIVISERMVNMYAQYYLNYISNQSIFVNQTLLDKEFADLGIQLRFSTLKSLYDNIPAYLADNASFGLNITIVNQNSTRKLVDLTDSGFEMNVRLNFAVLDSNNTYIFDIYTDVTMTGKLSIDINSQKITVYETVYYVTLSNTNKNRFGIVEKLTNNDFYSSLYNMAAYYIEQTFFVNFIDLVQFPKLFNTPIANIILVSHQVEDKILSLVFQPNWQNTFTGGLNYLQGLKRNFRQ